MIKKIMNKKDYKRINKIIANYLIGNASKEEIQKLELWVLESDKNRTYFNQMRNVWENTQVLPISTENSLQKVLKSINKQNDGISLWHFWQKIAAVLIIPLIIATIVQSIGIRSTVTDSNPAYHTAVSTAGTYSMLELPDGSKVWLNAGSSLRYPDRFEKNSRTVDLVGEAYFEVHSDVSSPFLVSTPSFVVKATGTHFNVSAYKNYPTPSVTLAEGKVSIFKTCAENPDNLIATLKPQQHMKYVIAEGKFTISNEDTYKYIAWKDGKLVFRNDMLTDVVRRIGLQYNVDFVIVDDKIKHYRYRATFENEPLNELLRLLKLSSPIDYREINPKPLPDGTFSRRKIILSAINEH